ncbi:unnamed protein product, partial [Phaeothamnion confervicola]
MSSLRQQVKALRVNAAGTSSAHLQQRKGRVSLLLSPEEAADIDLGTVREGAVGGLQSLAAVDERFAPFEDTIFGKDAQHSHRELQTQEVNARIDQSIATFLTLLAPHFLLRPAHLTLEYLVRHYKIHYFNADDLMRCVLPWHDTRLFARVVQLMNLKNTRWEFLRPVQRSGSPLPRIALAQRVMEDAALLQFICEAVRAATAANNAGSSLSRPASGSSVAGGGTTASADAQKRFRRPPPVPYPHLFSFFAAVVLEALDRGGAAGGLRERTARTLVPVLLDGLAATSQPEFQMACYMVTARLAMKVTLSAAVSDALLLTVAHGACAAGLEPRLLCALAILQGQHGGGGGVGAGGGGSS